MGTLVKVAASAEPTAIASETAPAAAANLKEEIFIRTVYHFQIVNQIWAGVSPGHFRILNKNTPDN
jgi:hypothetical protein